MTKFILPVLLVTAMPCFAQVECDLNNNGYPYEVGDVVQLANILFNYADYDPICSLYCDPDEDGNSWTIADIINWLFYMTDPDYPDNIPYFSFHPDSDTFQIGSASAAPGENLILPVSLTTVDTLTAFEFHIHADTGYIRIDSVVSLQGDSLWIAYSERSLHGFTFNFTPPVDSILLLPGDYHLADIYAHVNPDISEPVVTELAFSGCPEESFYTGLANLTFFEPVLVNSEITITPLGIDESIDGQLPVAVSLIASPNPFNAATVIRYNLPTNLEITLDIYDVLGQKVEQLLAQRQDAGPHQVTWNADEYPSGIYFAKLQAQGGSKSLKLVLLK